MTVPKFDGSETEQEKQRLLEAWELWEKTTEYHHLMAYYAVSDEIWHRTNPDYGV